MLIERASFAHNPRIYDPKGFADLGLESSWIDWLLRETETVHGDCGPSFYFGDEQRASDCPDHLLVARSQDPSL